MASVVVRSANWARRSSGTDPALWKRENCGSMSYHDREPLRILWCSASQRAGSLYTGLAGCAAEMLDLHAPREYGSFQEFAKK